jgi:hypothetical protein
MRNVDTASCQIAAKGEKMKKKYWLMLPIVLFFGYSNAQQPVGKTTGIYSDMSFNRESGDLSGVEIFILYTRDGPMVYFQDAEGSPNTPVVVPASFKGSTLAFILPERRGYSGKFIGTLVGDRLMGRFDSGQISKTGKVDFILKRGLSYWQSK